MFLKDYEKKKKNNPEEGVSISITFISCNLSEIPTCKRPNPPHFSSVWNMHDRSPVSSNILQCTYPTVNETQFLKAAKKHLNSAHNYVCS